MPKKYSENIKLQALELEKNGMSFKDIAKKLNIISGPQLIYRWKNESNIWYSNKEYRMCKEVEVMSKKLKNEFNDKQLKIYQREIKKLHEEIEKLKKENKQKDINLIIRDAKIEVLEKSIPSCTAIVIMNMMKMCKKEKEILKKTKIYKHFSCVQIYKLEAQYGLGTNMLIEAFETTKRTYSKFKEKYNLFSPREIFRNDLHIPQIPNYQSKAVENAINVIKHFQKFNKNSACSADEIHIWALETLDEHISVKLIRKLNRENSSLFKSSKRMPTRKMPESKKHNKFVRDDLVKDDFKNPNVIGIDGTYLKLLIGKPKKEIKLNCLISYDWKFGTIVDYVFDYTEHSGSVLEVLEKIKIYLNTQNCEHTINKECECKKILQSDRGNAFANEYVWNFIEEIQKLLHSMSNSGFKHNAPTESLNGWIKHKFFLDYGNYFGSIEEFKLKFKQFIELFNSKKIIKYNYYNTKNNQLIAGY